MDLLIRQHRQKAREFREALKTLPLGTLPARPSNSMTAVTCGSFDAYEIVQALRTDHAIEVAPNGGALKSRIFRVSHMGEHLPEDFHALVKGLENITSRSAIHAKPATRGDS